MKYIVKADVLERHNVGLIVEADSEEEAKELAEEMDGDIYYDDYDIIEQVHIKSIEEYEN